MIDDTFKEFPTKYNQVINIVGANLFKKKYLMVDHILFKCNREIDYTDGVTLFIQIVSSFLNLRVKMIISYFEI